MWRKGIVISILMILIILGIVSLFVLNKNRRMSGNPLKYIPVDASLLIKINDYEDIIRQLQEDTRYWNELNAAGIIKNMEDKMKAFDSLVIDFNRSHAVQLQNTIYASIHNIGNRKLEIIYYLQADRKLNENLLMETIQKFFEHAPFEKRTYDGHHIIEVSHESGKYAFSASNGIIMLSRSALLVENAIRQSKIPVSVDDDEGFKRLTRTAGMYADANVFINHRHFLTSLKIMGNKSLENAIESMEPIGDWSELDLLLKENTILLNGFSLASANEGQLIHVFRSQKPVEMEIDKAVPAYISGFISFGIDDIQKYHQDMHRHKNNQGGSSWQQEDILRLKTKYQLDIAAFMQTHFNNEVAMVFPDASSKFEDPYFLMETKSQSLAEQDLLSYLRSHARASGKKTGDFIMYSTIDKEKKYRIYQLPVSHIPSLVFGKLFASGNNRYCVFINNHLVFGRSVKALSEYIHYMVLNKTIYHETHYKDFKEYIPNESNFLLYINTPMARPLFNHFLNDRISQVLQQDFSIVKKMESIAIQFSVEGNMYYNNLALNYSSEVKEKPKTVWESMLDTASRFKPVFFTNHYSNEKELFVQDLSNQIYLINRSGRILWKAKLNEAINSEVFIIDYFNNGKLQLLFSSKNYLHLIDRNGNYVENYPVKLRSPATAGMNLASYEDDKQRIFIPCANKKVYNYYPDGKIVDGWEFDKTEHTVHQPVQHFIIGRKDYIILADKYRLYLLNRRGEERINPEKQIAKSLHNEVYRNLTHPDLPPCLVTTDTSGTIHHIFENGAVEQISLGTFSPEHYFLLQDINGDQIKDYIFLDKQVLTVYNHQGKKLYAYEFQSDIRSKPIYFEFSASDKKLGIYSQKEGNIYLINNNGAIHQGFPLIGNSPFSIGILNHAVNGNYNLIVCGDNNFLYNYRLK